MAAPALLRTIAATAVVVAALGACGSDSDPPTTDPAPAAATTPTVVSPAESVLGIGLLPPDGVVAAAQQLGTNELPPDAAVAPTDDDLPPTT